MREFAGRHRCMLLCLAVLWIKTVAVSYLTFDLVMTHWLEAVIFAAGPLAFLLIVFGLGMLLKASWQRTYYFSISLLLTVVLYSNTVYYREFADIITLPMLVMSGNAGDLTTSVVELVHWWDLLFFADLFVLGWFMVKKPPFLTVQKTGFREAKGKYALIGAAAFAIILLSLPQENHVMFGSDLLAEDREEFAVLRSGEVVTDEVLYTGDQCFASGSGEEELYYSDQIIYGDLFRFFDEEEDV